MEVGRRAPPWDMYGAVKKGPLLRAAGVVKVLGGSRVLRGVEASFEAGVAHVIEGANGSGKSTLLGLLGGRSAATSGRVLLLEDGVSVAEAGGLRAVVGWLGHELGLYPDLSARENIALHAGLRGVDAEEAWREGAAALGLEAIADRRVRVLSRGQRQRVALIRALVGSPRVLLLDEPSTGLDVASVEKLSSMVIGLAEAGHIVIVVTHDARFQASLNGQLWQLADGLLRRVSRETQPVTEGAT